eukprot:CAMPEP_0179036264 /NCGR_PEP_ID=MMETSP0796-20121207/13529_1 /TAXON_ID=73915 /ORGANISM="Pyrodinium bahamense, Strain pbaha01" /LENGTH=948 /DNA_ID=CAMNT_0020732547 /DNA_START=59 /DNA_END=2905 /DNA_ORIENTATION=+
MAGNLQSIEETKRLRPKDVFFKCGNRFLQHPLFSILMAALTMFVLVGDDIRLVFFEADDDSVFNWMTLGCLCLFTLEIMLSSLLKRDYFLGFWFMCDIFAAASLIVDLTIVSEAMLGYPEISVEHVAEVRGQGGVEESEYARASRASRVGTRVVRQARLLRVFRLLRLSLILKCLQRVSPKRHPPHPGSSPGESAELHETQGESRVGRKLSERTTQRVILLVLAMLFLVPQIRAGEDHELMSESAQYGANVIFQAWQDYELAALSSNSTKLLPQRRTDWEIQVLMYVYYHNWHAICPAGLEGGRCAASWLYKLCWIGYVKNSNADLVPDSLNIFVQGYIQSIARSRDTWDLLFSGASNDTEEDLLLSGSGDPRKELRPMLYVVGSIPDEVKGALARPWTTSCIESKSASRTEIVGVTLIPGIPCPRNAFRIQETMWYTPDIPVPDFFRQHMEGQFVFVFDLRNLIKWEAILGIVQTIFVIIVLAIGALLFSRDADQLVLMPIERMINKVDMIRKDPLYAIRLGDLQYKDRGSVDAPSGLEEKRNISKLKRRLRPGKKAHSRQRVLKKGTLETKILENAIIKLGSLLALGFGEAGSEIIGQNLDDDNATVDALVPGSKVEAIYGWCSIKHFATATDVLQEHTMVFVNQVAAIVHRIVDEHLGAANKNVGETFLMVWRIGLYEPELQSKVADLAVMSFVLVVAELNRDRQLAQYREHPKMLARLPQFRVCLGFGLHLGWSIEGAIGSEFKIDASYLSPHVNIACSLEAATTEYGVTILMSEPLVRSCNPLFSRHFRPIDHVKLQGSKTATRIFTVDLNYEILPVDLNSESRRLGIDRFQERQERERLKAEILLETHRVHEIFEGNKYVKSMRERFFLAFFQEFERGYLNYEAGEWDVAAQVLGRTKSMLWNSAARRNAEDGPSRALLEYMRGFNFEAPAGWPGWRELRER